MGQGDPTDPTPPAPHRRRGGQAVDEKVNENVNCSDYDYDNDNDDENINEHWFS